MARIENGVVQRRVVVIVPAPGIAAHLVGAWVCLQRYVRGDPGRPDRWEMVPGALPVGPWATSHQAGLALDKPEMLAAKIEEMRVTQVRTKNTDSRSERRRKFHEQRRNSTDKGSSGDKTTDTTDESSNKKDDANT